MRDHWRKKNLGIDVVKLQYDIYTIRIIVFGGWDKTNKVVL